tara:strand:+ start:725 stop:1255 length:531 start_codon:yes stop_codon:yes gene_type:complete
MFLQVNDEVIEVGFEKGKYIRRDDDVCYLHANKDDAFVNWADSSHDLNVWFEFHIEPVTFYVKTHHGFYIVWDSKNKCLLQVPELHARAVKMVEEAPGLTKTFARTFESTKKEASPMMKAVQLFYKEMDPVVSESHPHLQTKKERKTLMGSLWKELTKQEKQMWVKHINGATSCVE